ncbi:hypothetical protein [Porphyromonas loveana]|uniref:Uncharacterized protein n=1 Tax=Porphyromonas loveana TaxID=1884669 RepID=A0A2U1FSH1_9PORP|nr:hypothetical protein C7382_10136 [Porphyromonas loveana]
MQNQIINSVVVKKGHLAFIGNSVDSSMPQGGVVVMPRASVEISAKSLQIMNGFFMKKNAEFKFKKQ